MALSEKSNTLLTRRDGDIVTVTMNRPQRRNALSLDHLHELIDMFRSVGDSDARGVVLAANGPVFSAGHDFADMAGADLDAMRRLLRTCTDLMLLIQDMPQVVVARVHALATAAGCQLVASCDLAVAAESAAFAAPGGKAGWFCTTPMVAIGRTMGQKRALELALTGDAIDAATAADWGLVNKVVPDGELDAAVADLIGRATRGSASSKALGKRAFHTQIGMDLPQAYAYAIEVMAAASQTPDAKENVAAFLEKRKPSF
jgi:enoyl-CoA hydratase/carnithine racemase